MFFAGAPQLQPAPALGTGIEPQEYQREEEAHRSSRVRFGSPTGRNTWSGPYKSLHHATTAIARKLAHEFTERNQRLQQHQADRAIGAREIR